MTAAVAILEQAKAAGVTLWGEGGTLRYRGDKVAVESLLPMFNAHKAELLAALAQPPSRPSPLAFTRPLWNSSHTCRGFP